MQDNSTKIIVAEDDAVARAMLDRLLTRAGYEVLYAAENGAQALEHVERHHEHLDLLITDIMMPVMDGMELMSIVKNRYPFIPVIVLTAKEDRETLKQALKHGAADFLDKPIYKQALLESVNNVLSNSPHTQLKRTMATSRSVRKAQLDLMRSAAVEEDLDPGLIGYWFKPISDAGGDLFICRRLSDEMYCLILADIAGHDITSSYIAAEVKGLVAGLSEYLDRPAKLLEALNRKLMEMDFDHSHVCALCMAWNTSNGFIDLANAGLPHPYLLSAEGDLHEIPVDGMLLGMFEDAAFDEARFFLRHRERMLLFSDGLDAIDSSGVLRITWPALHTVTPVNHALLQMIQQLHLDEMKVEDDMILAAIEQPPPLNTSETPANSTELNLYIHSALNLVEPALEHMVRFLGTRQGFDPCFIDRMTFTVREIILNAIHHGNRGSVKQTVHIMAFADWLQRQVRVTVKDCGSGFDLPQILAEERTAHPLRDRGRGLLGAASFADSIHAENGEVHVSFAFTPFDDDSG